jgi:hypothetical protein
MRASSRLSGGKTALVSVFPRVHYVWTKGWIWALNLKEAYVVASHKLDTNNSCRGAWFWARIPTVALWYVLRERYLWRQKHFSPKSSAGNTGKSDKEKHCTSVLMMMTDRWLLDVLLSVVHTSCRLAACRILYERNSMVTPQAKSRSQPWQQPNNKTSHKINLRSTRSHHFNYTLFITSYY